MSPWTQEHFQKSHFRTTDPHASKCSLKFHHAKKKLHVNRIQNCCRLLWAKAHLKGIGSKLKTALWSHENRRFFFPTTDAMCSEPKRRETVELAMGVRYKHLHDSVGVNISTYGIRILHIWKWNINAKRYGKVLKLHMFLFMFFTRGHTHFRKTMLSCTLYILQKHESGS